MSKERRKKTLTSTPFPFNNKKKKILKIMPHPFPLEQ
jgi:hypothetical protein